MTDRPDPFDDLEFETAEAVEPEAALQEVIAVAQPAKAESPAAEAPAEAAPAAPAEAAKDAKAAKPAGGPSKAIAYTTLALSALACAGTISAVIVTVVAAQPKPVPPSPERAAIGRIEAMLTGQQKHLAAMAAETEAAVEAPAAGGAEIAALTAVVRANQEAIDRLPAAIRAQMPRPSAAVVRPVVVTKPGPAANDPRVAEVLRSQAALQRQIEALAARMAKTTAACVTQNDGQIRYP